LSVCLMRWMPRGVHRTHANMHIQGRIKSEQSTGQGIGYTRIMTEEQGRGAWPGAGWQIHCVVRWGTSPPQISVRSGSRFEVRLRARVPAPPAPPRARPRR
jgi:hypothetical protein